MTENMNDPRKDTDARNREFLRYEQTHKVQDYRLAEAEGEEQFDEDFQIRTCSMAASQEDRAQAQDRQQRQPSQDDVAGIAATYLL